MAREFRTVSGGFVGTPKTEPRTATREPELVDSPATGTLANAIRAHRRTPSPTAIAHPTTKTSVKDESVVRAKTAGFAPSPGAFKPEDFKGAK